MTSAHACTQAHAQTRMHARTTHTTRTTRTARMTRVGRAFLVLCPVSVMASVVEDLLLLLERTFHMFEEEDSFPLSALGCLACVLCVFAAIQGAKWLKL